MKRAERDSVLLAFPSRPYFFYCKLRSATVGSPTLSSTLPRWPHLQRVDGFARADTIPPCAHRKPHCLHAPYVCLFRHASVVYGPLSARQRHLFASFGTTASSICLCRHDGVVYMPLSARRHCIYASFGTTMSSICFSRHDSVVTMPLSASFMGLFRHDGVVDTYLLG